MRILALCACLILFWISGYLSGAAVHGEGGDRHG